MISQGPFFVATNLFAFIFPQSPSIFNGHQKNVLNLSHSTSHSDVFFVMHNKVIVLYFL